ncbi:hypothetical protein DFH08DRAFT_824006 [Mycena albidolilacea]|uniref:Lectin n=1 Tax=Mycena albidolilacea TaxID=1033008 RepID=A0AAD7EB22_9AGAR|nr:hypothetical protein DFH08DRAFT_824006 [Mycena albidolilacea]
MSFLFISRAGQAIKFQTILSVGEEGGATLNEWLIPDVLLLITGSCLSATSNADGAPVVNKNCGTNTTSLNSWVVPKGAGAVGTLQIFGDKCMKSFEKCLDVTGTNTDDTKLQIRTCAAENTKWLIISKDQKWVSALGSLAWSGKDKCLNVTNGNITDGNQIWNSIVVTTPKLFAILLKKNPVLCVAASTWSNPTGRGNIMLGDNLCMSPLGSITAGTKCVLMPCVASNTAQQWDHEMGVIDNCAMLDFALVLNVANGSETTGSQPQIWTGLIFNGVTNNINQNWIVTDTF